jgi:aryl-alcohol dehydrogenase
LRGHGGLFGLESVELPELGVEEILVRIVGVGMCHTDVLVRTLRAFAPLPFIGGHEGSGSVEAVGSAVSSLGVGAHVVLSFDSCGACRNCVDEHPAFCESFRLLNVGGGRADARPAFDGDGEPVSIHWFGQSSFATHAVVSVRSGVVVDPDLPLEILGPLGCGVLNGVGGVLIAARVRAGSNVAVFGAGAVGLSAVMAARIAGASTVVAVDRHSRRLELALELGATHVVQAGDRAAEAVTEIAGAADYSFETTGVPSVITDAVDVLGLRGVCGLIGVPTGPAAIDVAAIKRGRTVMAMAHTPSGTRVAH